MARAPIARRPHEQSQYSIALCVAGARGCRRSASQNGVLMELATIANFNVWFVKARWLGIPFGRLVFFQSGV
jgi:hypothetical protein